MGTISYGIYLLHLLVLNAIRRTAFENELLLYLATLAGVIAVASASHRWFERPILRLKERLRPAVAVTGPGQAARVTAPPA